MKHDTSLLCDELQSILDKSILFVSDRKLRLFCCACCRRFWSRLDARSRRLVELTETYSDGETSPQDLLDTRSTIMPEIGSVTRACMWAVAITDNWPPGERTERWRVALEFCITELIQKQTWDSSVAPSPPSWQRVIEEVTLSEASEARDEFASFAKTELRHQILLARDIFGLPSRGIKSTPLSVNSYRFDTLSSIAETIYRSRRFSDLPVLADALEEAGCTNSTILAHCRTKNEHARGCWVLDLLIGKH